MSTIPAIRPSRREDLVGSFGLFAATLLVVGTGVTLYLIVEESPVLPVLMPLVAVGTILLWFLRAVARRRERTIPVFEIGAVYATAVFLYTAYPLIGYMVNGGRYGPFNDVRLFIGQPTALEIARVAWFQIVHLVAFMLMYLAARGRRLDSGVCIPRVGWSVFWIALLLYGSIEVYFAILAQRFDLSAGGYEESYLVLSRLPLLVTQISGHLAGIKFTAGLAILAVLFTRYKRFRLLILGLLGVATISTVVRLGSRAELVLLLFASAMLYHACVRPIKTRDVVVAGAVGLIAFLAFGILRSYRIALAEENTFNVFAFNSEFDSLFANAVDIVRLKQSGEIGQLPTTFFLADLLAIIPQQLLPFAKISPSVWYVSTFYPTQAEQGFGLAFGTISESLLGGGWVDLVIRGGVLGVLCGRVYDFYAARRRSFLVLLGYVWVTIWVYQSFRNTTFAVFSLFVYRFLPVVLAILSVRLLAGSKEPRTHAIQKEQS